MEGHEHIITEPGQWSDRIEMLGYDVLALIANGKTEKVDTIIEHFQNADAVHYIMEKYKDDMALIHEGCPYNLDEWEKVLERYSYLEFGHDVRRKMGYNDSEKDGLLVLLNVILQEVSERRYK